MDTNTAEKETATRSPRVNARKLEAAIKKSRNRKGPLSGSAKKAAKTKAKAPKKARKTPVEKVTKPAREKKAKPVKELKLIETIDLPEPDEGSKSGAYIQKLLRLNSFTTEEIVLAVRHHFTDSVAGPSDVNYHRYQLKLAKTPSKLVAVNKEGQRHIVR